SAEAWNRLSGPVMSEFRFGSKGKSPGNDSGKLPMLDNANPVGASRGTPTVLMSLLRVRLIRLKLALRFISQAEAPGPEQQSGPESAYSQLISASWSLSRTPLLNPKKGLKESPPLNMSRSTNAYRP